MSESPKTYYKENRLKLLRAFCCTAETGSISAAAERLFLSQPTVSLQVKALERSIGKQLFERHGPRIHLTPEGEVYYQLAQPLVEEIDGLDEKFNARYGRIEGGNLDIAAGESTILYILPEYIKQFAEKYPGIRIKLHNVTGRDGMARLRANEADMAFGSMLEIPDDIIYRPCMIFDPTLITPLDHPLADKDNITLEDISQYGLILPPRYLTTWRLAEMVFRQHDLSFKVKMEAGGWEVIKRYVEYGLGISIVTGLCLKGDENIAQKPLSKYFPQRSYGVVVRKGKYLSPQARLFITMIDPDFFSARDVQ